MAASDQNLDSGARDPSKSRQRRTGFGDHVAASLAFFAITLAVSFANNVVVARIAGPEGRGLWALAVSINHVALPIVSLGLGSAATYFVGRHVARSTVAGLNLAWSAATLPLCALLVSTAFLLFGPYPGMPPMALAVIAAAAAAPAVIFSDAMRGFFLGTAEIAAFNLVQTVRVSLIVVLHLVTLWWAPEWVLVNLVVGYWVVALGIVVRQQVRRSRFTMPSRTHVRRSVGYGWKASGTSLADAALLRLDYLIMAPIFGVATTAFYATADQLITLSTAPATQAGKIMLGESASDREGDRALNSLGIALRLLTILSLAVAAGAAATFWFLIPLVFGDEFAPAYHAALILSPTVLFKGAHALVSRYLAGRGIQRPVVVAGLVAVSADVALLLLSVPWLGWLGVAAARTVASALQFGLTYRAFLRAGHQVRWRISRSDIEFIHRWVRARLRRRSNQSDVAPVDDAQS